MTGPFHPSELSDADGVGPTTTELGDALAVARDLESNLAAGDVHPSATFVDRVMGAVALEPLPQPAIAAGTALRGGRLGAMAAALADSWRVAFSGGRPFAVRAQAAAFVLVVVLAMGSLGGIAAVGAVRLLQPAPSQVASPRPSVPVVTSTQPDQNPSIEPSDRVGPTATPKPTDSDDPEASEDPGETPEATETDKSGGGGGGTQTPRPNRTQRPTETDDHGSGNDGGGSGGGGGGGGGYGGGGGEPTENPGSSGDP